jgi:diguanylate cyclase (GGDEF)-like protein
MPGLLDHAGLGRVFSAWRRALRLDPLLSRVAMPDLMPLATTFNNALTGDDDGALSDACESLVRANLEPSHVIRITTFLAETFTDEVGATSGAVTKSLIGTLGHVCGLMVTTMVADVAAMARRDPLTGLENRRAWDEALAHNIGAPGGACAVMIDLDGLKAINDGSGHEAGDAHLKKFAADLSAAISDPGRVYRLAGDEYAVLFPGRVAEALRESLLTLTAKPGVAKFSFGISHTDEAAGNAAALVDLADKRMYEMKQAHKKASA